MRFSFIIPAHNEAALLPATLDALRDAAPACGAEFEILVVDDASTDATAAVAASHGAVVVPIDRREFAAERNAGAARASGDVFVFIDADTVVNARAVAEAAQAVARGATFGGAPIRFDDPCPLWARAMLPLFLVVFRAARMVPGCFFVVTRALFDKAGGFDEGVFAGEEALFARVLRRAGGRHYLGRTPVVTSGRKLRDHTGSEIWGALVRAGLKGRRGVSSREGLDLWYGERRPETPISPAAACPAPPSSSGASRATPSTPRGAPGPSSPG